MRISTITKLVKNIKTFIKYIGTDKEIKKNFISPMGLFQNPKNRKGLEFDKYILAIHDFEKLPKNLKANDIIITDNKSYIHFDYDNDTINIFTNHDLNIEIKDNIYASSNETIDIKSKDITVTANNKFTAYGKSEALIKSDKVINLTAPKINFNADDMVFNVKNFEVNASEAITFTSPSGKFTHNGINVGDTHTHFVPEVIFGGSESKTPTK